MGAESILGFNTIKPLSKKTIDENMMFGKKDVKSFGSGTSGRWQDFMKTNPYGAAAESKAYGQQKDAIAGQTDTAVREATDQNQKYGNADQAGKRVAGIRRAAMGAQAATKRNTSIDFLQNRTAFDQFLMNFGLTAGKEGQDANMSALTDRRNLMNQNSQANAGAFSSLMTRAATGGAMG